MPTIESSSLAQIGTSSTTVTIPKPAGTVAGDFLVLYHIAGVRLLTSITGPAAFDQLFEVLDVFGVARHRVMSRFAVEGEPDDYTITVNNTAVHSAIMLRISGVDPLNPIDVSQTQSISGNRNTPNAVSTVDGALLLLGLQLGRQRTASYPADATGVNKTADNTVTTIAVAFKDQVSAGSTGTSLFEVAGGSADAIVTSTIVVSPVALAPPEAFDTADWAVADSTTGARLLLLIDALPTSVEPITDIEYRLDSGSAVSTGLTAPDIVVIAGLTNGQAYNVEVRAVSANGAGPWSSVKAATPTIGGGGGGIGGIARLIGNGLLG